MGVVFDQDSGNILISFRPPGKVMAGYWEFPGGKLEAGENCFQALARELHEELGIIVDEREMELIGKVEHLYPHGLAQLDLIIIKRYNGEARGLEGQQVCWCQPLITAAPTPLLPTATRVFEILQSYLGS